MYFMFFCRMHVQLTFVVYQTRYQGVVSGSITDSSVLSNAAVAPKVSCLGLCGRDICPKSTA